MRLDAVLGPDARHGHMRDVASEFGSELARRPVRGAVGWRVLGRACEHTCLKAIGHLVAFAPGVASEQASQPISGKALAPAIDVAVTAIELGSDVRPSQSI